MRVDQDGRDVTGLPGLWDESDTLTVSLRVFRPLHPPDAWYQLLIAIGGMEYPIGNESILASDCVRQGEEIVKEFASMGIAVVHDGLYEH